MCILWQIGIAALQRRFFIAFVRFYQAESRFLTGGVFLQHGHGKAWARSAMSILLRRGWLERGREISQKQLKQLLTGSPS